MFALDSTDYGAYANLCTLLRPHHIARELLRYQSMSTEPPELLSQNKSSWTEDEKLTDYPNRQKAKSSHIQYRPRPSRRLVQKPLLDYFEDRVGEITLL